MGFTQPKPACHKGAKHNIQFSILGQCHDKGYNRPADVMG